MQQPEGSSVYLRLSTRTITQLERPDDRWEESAIKGGYWLKQPAPGAAAAI
jgi:pyruvate dehydrogenase E1 component